MNSLKGLGKSKIKNASSNPNYKPENEAAMMAYIDKYSKMDLEPAIRKKDKRREAEEKKWKQKGGAEAVVNRILPPTCQLEPGFVDAMVLEMRSTRAYTIKQPSPPSTRETLLRETNDFTDVDNAKIMTEEIATLHWKFGEACTNPEDEICSHCKSMRLERQLCVFAMEEGFFGVNLRDAQKKTNCPMCRILVACVARDPQMINPPWGDNTMILLKLRTFALSFQKTQKDGAEATQKLGDSRRFYATLIDGRTFGKQGDTSVKGNPEIEERYGLQLIKSPVPDPREWGIIGKGRLMKTHQLDFELLKKWELFCSAGHLHTCKPAAIVNDSILFEGFRLVDVVERRVVPAPPGATYVALSYVWGNDPQLENKAPVRERLYSPGGLHDSWSDISIVIKDAMLLCEQFGRYLWVDALCIMQDDTKDKAVQIQRMDQVYSQASFTLVTASTNSAHEPIPGVRPFSRNVHQHLEAVGGVAISTIQPQFSSSILSSKWNTRGWTLQEKHLSKRLLVITNDQAFWHCEAVIWYEDTVLETIPPVQVSIDSDTKNVAVPKLDLSITPIAVYAQLADAYLRRDMKKQSDALSCIQGILNQLDSRLGKMFYSIPECYIDCCILWEWPVRRDNIEIERRLSLPSWCWITQAIPLDAPRGSQPKSILSQTAYSDSRVRMGMSGEDFICSMVEFWRYSEDGSVVPVESRAYHSRNDPLFEKYYRKRGPRPAVPFRIQFYYSDEEKHALVHSFAPPPAKKKGIRGLFSRKDEQQDLDFGRAIIERGLLLHGGLADMVPRILGFWAEVRRVCISFPNDSDPRCTVFLDSTQKHVLGKCLLNDKFIETARTNGHPLIFEVAITARNCSNGPHPLLPKRMGWYYHGLILHRFLHRIGNDESLIAKKVGVIRNLDAEIWDRAEDSRWEIVLLA